MNSGLPSVPAVQHRRELPRGLAGKRQHRSRRVRFRLKNGKGEPRGRRPRPCSSSLSGPIGSGPAAGPTGGSEHRSKRPPRGPLGPVGHRSHSRDRPVDVVPGTPPGVAGRRHRSSQNTAQLAACSLLRSPLRLRHTRARDGSSTSRGASCTDQVGASTSHLGRPRAPFALEQACQRFGMAGRAAAPGQCARNRPRRNEPARLALLRPPARRGRPRPGWSCRVPAAGHSPARGCGLPPPTPTGAEGLPLPLPGPPWCVVTGPGGGSWTGPILLSVRARPVWRPPRPRWAVGWGPCPACAGSGRPGAGTVRVQPPVRHGVLRDMACRTPTPRRSEGVPPGGELVRHQRAEREDAVCSAHRSARPPAPATCHTPSDPGARSSRAARRGAPSSARRGRLRARPKSALDEPSSPHHEVAGLMSRWTPPRRGRRPSAPRACPINRASPPPGCCFAANPRILAPFDHLHAEKAGGPAHSSVS